MRGVLGVVEAPAPMLETLLIPHHERVEIVDGSICAGDSNSNSDSLMVDLGLKIWRKSLL